MSKTRLGVERHDAGEHAVLIGEGVLVELERALEQDLRPSRVFILGDENTLDLCYGELVRQVPALNDAQTIEVRSGERSKDIEVCRALWSHLAERGADRATMLVCLGGGVVTDLGGFVAGTYMRGIRTVHVPTTLMGMVDAAIGGKTAIDLMGIKNLVGLFAPPAATYVYPRFLRTLGKRELLNGVAEMVKHGLVRDADHWNAVRRAPLHDLDALAPLIARSAGIKAAVVQEDPREGGSRKLLNFGHTIGHALEAFALEGAQRSLLHGEAVAIGMVCGSWLSWRLGHLERTRMDAIQEHLLGLFQPFVLQATDHHRVIELMRSDKK
ncbi:MAG TPA: 3-dehydroquinate synthase, partial [Flavobacteriales bacterium]|nr:3-dehydroquinate synthase [Flavobacteriales bacterium]